MASPEYRRFIEDLKTRVTTARISAARAVCSEMILLYWDIGHGIVEKQRLHDWGDSVVEMVAADLRRAFPHMTGFSPRNVWDMRRFFETYTAISFLEHVTQEIALLGPDVFLRQPVAEIGKGEIRRQIVANLTEGKTVEFLQQLVTEVPWGQNLLILNKLSTPAARLYYHRHHPLRGKGRRRSRIRPAHQEEPHRCRRLPTSIQTPGRFERQTPNCQTTGRCGAYGATGEKRRVTEVMEQEHGETASWRSK